MENMMEKLFNKVNIKRHYICLDEENVLETLKVIDGVDVWYVNKHLEVGNCGISVIPEKWFIHFNASKDQWGVIVETLKSKFNLVICDSSNDVYLMSK